MKVWIWLCSVKRQRLRCSVDCKCISTVRRSECWLLAFSCWVLKLSLKLTDVWMFCRLFAMFLRVSLLHIFTCCCLLSWAVQLNLSELNLHPRPCPRYSLFLCWEGTLISHQPTVLTFEACRVQGHSGNERSVLSIGS